MSAAEHHLQVIQAGMCGLEGKLPGALHGPVSSGRIALGLVDPGQCHVADYRHDFAEAPGQLNAFAAIPFGQMQIIPLTPQFPQPHQRPGGDRQAAPAPITGDGQDALVILLRLMRLRQASMHFGKLAQRPGGDQQVALLQAGAHNFLQRLRATVEVAAHHGGDRQQPGGNAAIQ
jgi:hypothetical protein